MMNPIVLNPHRSYRFHDDGELAMMTLFVSAPSPHGPFSIATAMSAKELGSPVSWKLRTNYPDYDEIERRDNLSRQEVADIVAAFRSHGVSVVAESFGRDG